GTIVFHGNFTEYYNPEVYGPLRTGKENNNYPTNIPVGTDNRVNNPNSQSYDNRNFGTDRRVNQEHNLVNSNDQEVLRRGTLNTSYRNTNPNLFPQGNQPQQSYPESGNNFNKNSHGRNPYPIGNNFDDGRGSYRNFTDPRNRENPAYYGPRIS